MTDDPKILTDHNYAELNTNAPNCVAIEEQDKVVNKYLNTVHDL